MLDENPARIDGRRRVLWTMGAIAGALVVAGGVTLAAHTTEGQGRLLPAAPLAVASPPAPKPAKAVEPRVGATTPDSQPSMDCAEPSANPRDCVYF